MAQFSVDDSSPTVAYFPFGDTDTVPNLSAGWNPFFFGSGFATAPGETGIGQSQHITSRNGASLSLNWTGTSIQLFGNTTANASFSLSLDGTTIHPNSSTPNLLASIDALSNTNHSLILTAITPQLQVPPDSSLLVFDKAVITSPPPANFSDIIFTEHPVDDNDIRFAGQWSLLPQPPSRQTQSQSDFAQLTFSGISVRIFGATSPTSGNYSVLLDNTQFPILSARSSFTSSNSLLFFASGLAPNISHQVTIRNEGGILQLSSGGFTVFSSGEPTALPPLGNNGSPTSTAPIQSPSSSPLTPPPLSTQFTRGTIAALVLAGFLAFLILTAVLFYFCIWRPRRHRQKQRARDSESPLASPPSRSRKPVPRAYRESSFPTEKDQERDPAAIRDTDAILDIGPTRSEDQPHSPHDDTINITPEAVSAAGGNELPVNREADRHVHRHSGRSTLSGFARWKRDINTLSGLTALGLNFGHSDEKSPSGLHGDHDGNNGASDFIYGRYYSGMDGQGGVARISSVGAQSSSHSYGRFGRKRSGTNQSTSGQEKSKGRLSSRIGSAVFPFRLSSGSRQGDSSTHDQRENPPHEDESLSGFTSLSYASDPDLTAYLNVKPPSYAASVSQHTGSGSNGSSPPSVPRSVTQSPPNQSRNIDVPPSPQDLHGPSPLSEVPVSPEVGEEHRQAPHPTRRRSTDDNGVHSTGMHILGVGGSLAGIGGPISMRAAIRGLSPRISKTRSGERRQSRTKGKGKEKGVEKKQVQEEAQNISPQAHDVLPTDKSDSDIANVGHEISGTVVGPTAPTMNPGRSIIPSNLADNSGSRTGSPFRALPPIPVPSSSSNAPRTYPIPPSQPHLPTKLKNDQSESSEPQKKDLPSKAPVASSAPSRNVPDSSPSGLDFEQDPPPTSFAAAPPSSSSSSSNNERRFKPRTTLGDAAGLGPHGPIQSFAEAAAMAATQDSPGGIPTGGILVEGSSNDSPSSRTGESGNGRRLSLTSRVHFEDDATYARTSPTTLTEEQRLPSANVQSTKESERETEARFRLTPPSGQSPTLATFTTVPSPTDTPFPLNLEAPPQPPGTSSFLDFNSQPPSLHSQHLSEATGLERNPSSGATDTSSGHGRGRIWSMQLPGRHILLDSETELKSKWSNTTMHTARSEVSSSNSGYGSPEIHSAVPATSDGSSRSNIFPFPLAIPTSPNMPEGFAGVEPSPSLMSPIANLPTLNPSGTAGDTRHIHTRATGIPGASRHRHDHDNNNDSPEIVSSGNNETADSPTDSFPYSISEVHFRNSVGTVSDVDLEPSQVQYAARQHTFTHPPLPSVTLTPQRFTPSQEHSQEQLQTQQSTSSLMQRVFGGGGSGGGGSGSGSGSATPRTPLTGFLKPSSS